VYCLCVNMYCTTTTGYCLCVNMYCTTTTGCLPNCGLTNISYHILFINVKRAHLKWIQSETSVHFCQKTRRHIPLGSIILTKPALYSSGLRFKPLRPPILPGGCCGFSWTLRQMSGWYLILGRGRFFPNPLQFSPYLKGFYAA
jgi:hypothetical protein